MLTAKEKSLLSALEPRAASEGVEIVTLEIVGSKKAPTIRVYIDAARRHQLRRAGPHSGLGRGRHGRAGPVPRGLHAGGVLSGHRPAAGARRSTSRALPARR